MAFSRASEHIDAFADFITSSSNVELQMLISATTNSFKQGNDPSATTTKEQNYGADSWDQETTYTFAQVYLKAIVDTSKSIKVVKVKLDKLCDILFSTDNMSLYKDTLSPIKQLFIEVCIALDIIGHNIKQLNHNSTEAEATKHAETLEGAFTAFSTSLVNLNKRSSEIIRLIRTIL